MDLTPDEIELLLQMARKFYGYGAYDRPYWFIGTEPGGEDIDHLRRKLRSWKDLGCEEVVCNKKHHEGAEILDFHRRRPRLQPTWRPLMLGFMSYKNLCSEDDVVRLQWLRDEQARRFGCDGGESAVLELGGLPAADRNHWHYRALNVPTLTSRDEYVAEYFEKCAFHLREMVAEAKPKFVWMYGARNNARNNYRKYWKIIAGGEFESRDSFEYRQTSTTAFLVTDHTTSRGKTNPDWVALGSALRDLTAQNA